MKDHDYIVGVDSLTEIASQISDENSDARKHWLKVEQKAVMKAAEMYVRMRPSASSSSPATS